jgi:hypothetical protein
MLLTLQQFIRRFRQSYTPIHTFPTTKYQTVIAQITYRFPAPLQVTIKVMTNEKQGGREGDR